VTAGGVSRAVLVTGCSSGIGRATALRLTAAGWRVYATARRPETLGELGRAGCRLLALDVLDDGSMRAAVDAVVAAEGAVGALVNNAGYGQYGAVESVPMDLARRQFETNVLGPARLIQLVLPGMRRQRWGRIVNVSSMGGRLTFPGGGYYHATKYALEALTDALRFEVAGFGVHAILVEPGLIRSGFAEAAAESAGESGSAEDPYAGFNTAVIRITRDSYVRGWLSRLGGTPDDVARTIERALASRRPRARYRVTNSARVMIAQRRLLPDRLWDRLMRTTFPRPS
jgi:NAD(P)-dependent dehydrogenase (short-subunit alcohol dehydrogenase family)